MDQHLYLLTEGRKNQSPFYQHHIEKAVLSAQKDVGISTLYDIKKLQVTARVDWVEIRITLPRASQPRHIRNRMPKNWGKPPYVTAETEDISRTALSFIFRVQDPTGPDQLLKDAQCLVQPGEPPLTDESIEIIGVEVALDVAPTDRDCDTKWLAEMLTNLLVFKARFPGGSRPLRVTPPNDPGFKPREVRVLSQITEAVEHGWSMNAGDQDASYRMRAYAKTYDTVDGESYKTLPVDKHRARIETTLTGNEVPFKSLGEWRTFEFDSLRTKHFSWRKRDLKSIAQWVVLLDRFFRAGRVDGRKIGTSRRNTNPNTKVDTVFGQAIKNAFEKLSRHHQKSKFT